MQTFVERHEQPVRSRVAPIKGEPEQSKLAAELVTLNRALRAASEAREEAEKSKDELSKVKESLHLAEETLTQRTEAFRRQAAQVMSKQQALEQELARAAADRRTSETRLRWWAGSVLLAFALAVPAFTVFVVLRVSSQPAPVSHEPEVKPLPSNRPKVFAQPLDKPEPVQAELKKLDNLLDHIPLEQVAAALAGANEWLKATGLPPCSVGFGDRDIALVVAPARNHKGLLAPAFLRCAEALEHVLK